MKIKYLYLILFLVLLALDSSYGTIVKIEVGETLGEIDIIDNIKELNCSISTNKYTKIEIKNIFGIYYSNNNTVGINIVIENKGNRTVENIEVISYIGIMEEATEKYKINTFTNVIKALNISKSCIIPYKINLDQNKEYDIRILASVNKINNINYTNIKYKRISIKKKNGVYILYDNTQTHQYICYQAAEIFGDSIFGKSGIDGSHLGKITDESELTICGGACSIDEYNSIWGYRFPFATVTHAWDADNPNDAGSYGFIDLFCNAYWHASRLWREKVIPLYINGDKELAYECLGRVCHLIQDMTVPAHAHQDMHALDDDCYEDWMNEEGWYKWDYQDAIDAGGLINIPWKDRPSDISEEIFPLYYLMYTANQTADYFASDDVDGDTDDRRGWMNYSNLTDTWSVI